MLFFIDEGCNLRYAMSAKDNNEGLALNWADMKEGVNIIETLCAFHNLMLDDGGFIERYICYMKMPDDEFFSLLQKPEVHFDRTMETKILEAIKLSAIKAFGDFSGHIIDSYLKYYLDTHGLIEILSADFIGDNEVDYPNTILLAIINALEGIVLIVKALFYSGNSFVEDSGLLENQAIKYRIVPLESGYAPLYEIEDHDLSSFILFFHYGFSKSDKNFCECKNCRRMFIPTLRKKEVYCTHIYRNGKTCKEVGFENTMDDINKAYRTAYKTNHAFKTRNRENFQIAKQFENWNSIAKEMKQKVREDAITEEEYYNFLKKDFRSTRSH